MERTVRDLIARVDGLMARLDEQPTEATRDQLRAIRVALKGLLTRWQDRQTRRGKE